MCRCWGRLDRRNRGRFAQNLLRSSTIRSRRSLDRTRGCRVARRSIGTGILAAGRCGRCTLLLDLHKSLACLLLCLFLPLLCKLPLPLFLLLLFTFGGGGFLCSELCFLLLTRLALPLLLFSSLGLLFVLLFLALAFPFYFAFLLFRKTLSTFFLFTLLLLFLTLA